MTARDADLVGQTVDAKYRVEALLGRGGMGAVFRAVHLGTDRIVALKVIAPALAEQPEYLARFSREARACGRLRHPGIVDVTDFGVARHNGRSLAYLVMEFLDGMTLAAFLEREPRPPLPWVIDILEQVCSAVEEAHRQGILHRDLKPENIWLESNRYGGSSVKVLDFGLAKLDGPETLPPMAGRARPPASRGATEIDVTLAPERTGVTLDRTIESAPSSAAMSGVSGTPAYMSPEQTRGDVVTPRSDVYSIGVIAYRMIAGRLPFEGTVSEVLAAQLTKAPTPLRSVRPDVHEDAARLIAAAMAKDPAERPASAGTFGNMLGAQLEPASAFFRRAAVLLIDRAGLFLTVALIAAAPMLGASVLLALWAVLHGPLGIPGPGPAGLGAALTLLFLLSLAMQTALGVLPIFVLRAVAEPQRPLDARSVWQAYAPRLRRWLRAMLPFTFALTGLVLWLLAAVAAGRWFGPWVRQFPAPARLAIVLPLLLLPPLAIAYAVLRRHKTSLAQLGTLGAVMLVEDLPFGPAGERTASLLRRAGGLRNAVQRRFVILFSTAAALFGAYISSRSGQGAGHSLLAITPVLTLVFTLFGLVNGIVNALMYLSARRANGESLARILEDLAPPPPPAE